jgi:hypothetical protein
MNSSILFMLFPKCACWLYIRAQSNWIISFTKSDNIYLASPGPMLAMAHNVCSSWLDKLAPMEKSFFF